MGIKQAVKKEPQALPGESKASQVVAGIGHNQAPPEEQVILDFREAMIERLPTWEQRIADLEAACERAVIDSQESAGKGGDVVKSIRALMNAIADAHKEVKAPYFNAGKVADNLKNAPTARLEAAKRTIEGKMTEFLRAEEARREKERREAEAAARAEAERAAAAERARAEAEGQGDLEAMAEVEAVAAPAVMSKAPEPIRSADTGVAVAGRKEWQCQVKDYELAVIDMLGDEKVREAIDACAKRRMRAGLRNQPGVKCWQAIAARTY